ncbi:PD-(D/E)XK nuclease family protein [Rufibacter tibetensis]|uniref:PD-(D/E)XK nuclease family protein n=1 Tax=Rufibacter tibetensis TaxID=512763 RepID=UPI000780D3C1|nr:PD-(D/E)XK nuclease family protein [Rufibacter tibetensis]
MEYTILPVESIQERDVDMLLLEELSTDDSFCEWFIQELGLPKLTKSKGAWRSISAFGLGETDILFSYESSESTIYILIENKLDANFQDNQHGRYRERAAKYIDNDNCQEAFCVLVAPQLYCENQGDFNSFISYEQIANWFEEGNTKRSLFKSKLLKIAVEKLRRGYQPLNSEPVQKFWHAYWSYREAAYPSLKMKEPSIVPHNSDWPMLYSEGLNGVIFYHKLRQGNVDATFNGFPDGFEARLSDNLPQGARLVRHSKSFSIRIFSGVVDRTKDFDTQVDLVENGFRNLVKLRDWITLNGFVKDV